MIIEDVTTSGASIAETIPIIRAQADVDIVGLMFVSLDRRKSDRKGTISALRFLELKGRLRIPDERDRHNG